MNLLIALIMLAAPPKSPQVYYYNCKKLVELHTIETANVRQATLRFFVDSPYELSDARVDSVNVSMCLPEISVRREMKLRGRWYIIRWHTRLTTGSTRHTIVLYRRHREYRKTFYVNVEGSERIQKPQGVN